MLLYHEFVDVCEPVLYECNSTVGDSDGNRDCSPGLFYERMCLEESRSMKEFFIENAPDYYERINPECRRFEDDERRTRWRDSDSAMPGLGR